MKKPPINWFQLVITFIYLINVILQGYLALTTHNAWYFVTSGLWLIASILWTVMFLASVYDRVKYNRWLAKQDKPVGRDVQVVYKYEWPVVKEQDDKN